jgi:hypothetical protein
VDAEGPPRVLVVVGQAQLRGDRVGLDVYAQRGGQMLLSKVGPAGQIDEDIAFAIERIQRRSAQPPAGVGP